MEREIVLQNLAKLVDLNKLKKIRKISDIGNLLGLYEGNVASVAGLKVYADRDPERARVANARQGSVLHVSNTPAMQQLAQPYLIKDILSLANERLEGLRTYDEELKEAEGSFADALSKGRGHRNPAHLLEQALIRGPTGSEAKRGATPFKWDLLYEAADIVIRMFKDAGVSDVMPRHLVPCTPGSTGRGLKISHVMNKSAGEPYFSDEIKADENSHKEFKGTSKGEHLLDCIEQCTKFFKSTNRLAMWDGRAFARGDRATEIGDFEDSETARDNLVLHAKDRLIIAQSFILQTLDGLVTQALMNETSSAPMPEIDMREPWHLSAHFESGMQLTKSIGEKAFSIGTDESAWDQHFAPQSWYLVYLVYKALLPETMNIGVVYTDRPVIFSVEDQARLEAMTPGDRGIITLKYNDENFDTHVKDFEAEMFVISTESYLRRLFASVSGTGVAMGDIIVRGYKTVIDTPKHGKFQCGWGMPSGNFMTFYANSIANLGKLKYIQLASQDPEMRAAYQREFGYLPPRMDLRWSVVRGDDAGQVWEILDDEMDPRWIPSEIMANWLTLTGGKANAKKQETSDEFGRWMLGFAQIFTNENYPRGVASVVRVLERNTFNERDEVVLDDPDSGDDLRPYILLMSKVGRISRLWGIFGAELHPLAEEMSALIQDLDREGRLLPPRTPEERAKASRAFQLVLLRRGTLPVDLEVIIDLWSTGLAPFTEERYRQMEDKLSTNWSPITAHADGRDIWRKPSAA